MRTKTLLTAIAALAAGIAINSSAQVYSANIVGYANLTMSSGFALVANQFNVGVSNGASEVFPSLPDGTSLYAWDVNSGGYIISIYDTGGGSTAPVDSWYMSDYSTPTNQPIILPGEAVFLQLPSAVTNTIAGTVITTNSVLLPAGYSMVGSVIPLGGVVNDGAFNLNPPDGSTLYTWNPTAGAYVITIYDTGGGSTLPDQSWYMSDYSTPTNAPSLTVGQGVFLQLPSSYTWTQSLTNSP